MRGQDIHKNVPVSVTKLTLRLRLLFISARLTTDKLSQVNDIAITGSPKMSLALEAKNMPAVIIKIKFLLVQHTDDLDWYITINQQEQMLVQHLDRIVRRQNVTSLQILWKTTNCILIFLIFKIIFMTNTKDWNCLAIEMPPTEKSDLSYLYGVV